MPTEIIPDRICPHCGGNEWYHRDRKEKGKNPRREYTCSVIRRQRDRNWKKNNTDKIRVQSKKWRKNNVEIVLGYGAKQRQSSAYISYRKTDKSKLRQRKDNARARKLMTNAYIKGLIARTHDKSIGPFDPSAVTEEEVQLYREVLTIKRKLRNEIKKTSSRDT